jgi:hypothetical protein
VTVRDVEVAKSLMTRMLDGDAAEAAAEEVVAAAEAGGRRRNGDDDDESPPKSNGRRRGGRRRASSSSSDSSSSSSSEEDDAPAPAAPTAGRRPSKARAASARARAATAAAPAAAAAAAATTGRPTRGAKRLAREGEDEEMDVDAAGAASQQLTEAQITAVAVAVRELLLEQRGSTSHSVDDLLARLSSTSASPYSREAVSAALSELERRHADAPGSAAAVAPIMFEPATGRFYDAS